MAAVTQTVPNFLGGVSKQTDQKKQPGQVRDCLNAYPDPTFGLMKRPGFKFIKNIYTPSSGTNPELKDAKWFFIKRDNLETYIGCILDKDDSNHSAAPIRIWNKDGTACTVTFESSPADAKLYLDTTRNNYDVLTVQDTSIITNKTKTVTAKTVDSDYVAKSKGTVRLKTVAYSIKYEVNLKVGSTNYPVSFTTINAEDLTAPDSSSNPSDEKYNTAKRILDMLKGGGSAPYNAGLLDLNIPGHTLTVDQLDASLELTLKTTGSGTPYAAFELTTTDSQGGIHIDSFSEQVRTQADLPAESTSGRLAKVVALGGANDTFWLKFFANTGTSGKGNWEETVDPTVSTGMNAATLPHELFNSSPNTFVFRQPKEADQSTLAWKDRAVGDLTTNSDPSFVGATIQQAFYHNNRLGFLTKDNVSMSKVNSFFNFYYTSALTATDSDPIDINCSSIRPAVLHAVIPSAQGLILFSKNQQFIMFSDAEILTPSSAVIRGISNYEVDSTIDPVDVGTSITFVSKTPSYTRIFGMQTRGSEESPVVMDIGKIVSEWVPDTVNSLLSSPQNSLIALYGDNSSTYVGDNKMYIFKTYSVGDKVLMQSWFNWELPGNIQHASIDSDTMWSVVEYKGKYTLISASLTQTPEEKIIETSDGQRVNPHMDLYGAVSSMTYDSTNELTKCYLPTGMKDNENLTPVLLIVGNGTTNFAGVTESGFTITPDRPTGQTHATSSPYFEVPNKNISNLTALSTVDTISAADGSRTAGTYTIGVDDYTTDGSGSGATFSITINGSGAAAITITATGEGYAIDETFTVTDSKLGSGGGASLTFDVATITSDVIVGYKYNYDVELPKTYYKLSPDGSQYDYTAALTIARMKFAVGLSSVLAFKVKSKGYRGPLAEFTGQDSLNAFTVPFVLKKENGIRVTLDGATTTDYTFTTTDTTSTVTFNTAPKGHTVKQLFGGTGYTAAVGVSTTSSGSGTGLKVNTTVVNGAITAVTFYDEGTGYKQNEVITISGGTISATFLINALPQKIAITTDTWYDVQPSSEAGQYLADDVPLVEDNVFTLPIHQRSENFNVRVFSNSPFPVSLTSMMWEGQYSPRFYRRT